MVCGRGKSAIWTLNGFGHCPHVPCQIFPVSDFFETGQNYIYARSLRNLLQNSRNLFPIVLATSDKVPSVVHGRLAVMPQESVCFTGRVEKCTPLAPAALAASAKWRQPPVSTLQPHTNRELPTSRVGAFHLSAAESGFSLSLNSEINCKVYFLINGIYDYWALGEKR